MSKWIAPKAPWNTSRRNLMLAMSEEGARRHPQRHQNRNPRGHPGRPQMNRARWVSRVRRRVSRRRHQHDRVSEWWRKYWSVRSTWWVDTRNSSEMVYETQWWIFEPGVDESGAKRSHEVELYGLITKTTKFAKKWFNDVTCTVVFEHKAISEEGLMILYHWLSLSIIFLMSTVRSLSRALAWWSTRYITHTDKDTVTNSDLTATPSSFDTSEWPGTPWIMLSIFDERGQCNINTGHKLHRDGLATLTTESTPICLFDGSF